MFGRRGGNRMFRCQEPQVLAYPLVLMEHWSRGTDALKVGVSPPPTWTSRVQEQYLDLTGKKKTTKQTTGTVVTTFLSFLSCFPHPSARIPCAAATFSFHAGLFFFSPRPGMGSSEYFLIAFGINTKQNWRDVVEPRNTKREGRSPKKQPLPKLSDTSQKASSMIPIIQLKNVEVSYKHSKAKEVEVELGKKKGGEGRRLLNIF